MGKPLRIDRILSNFGYCTRKQARSWVKEERILVKGEPAADVAQKADPRDLLIEGAAIDHPDGIRVMLNKPTGYVCSHDPADGTTVYELLPPMWTLRDPKVSSIGRLDKDTSGLILLTDDTMLQHRLTAPARKIPKLYEVEVDHPLDQGLIERFAAGTLMLKDEKEPCLPAEMEIVSATRCTVTLHEGRYHQVRRMFAACGYEVAALSRCAFGRLKLGDLAEGEYREFDPGEV